MIHQTDYIPEIRCPYCFYSISINQDKKDNNKIIMFCENCGTKEIEIEEFNLLMEKNNQKICLLCYKSVHIKKMFYSKKCNNYICESCYSKYLKENTLDGDIDYTLILNSGKRCSTHKNLPILLFCSTCEKHLCLECKVKHLNHKIINLPNEAKKRNNIEEMKSMLMKEEKEIENEENFGKLLINTLAKTFENNAKNRKDLYNFKKILYQYFFNNNNYSAFKNIDFIFNKENNPDLFINEKEFEDIQQIIDSINDYNNIDDNDKPEKDIPQKNQNDKNINKNNIRGRNNVLEKEIWKRNSLTVIKQSKRKTKKLPSLPDLDTSTASSNISININNNNINTRKKIEAKTPIKLTRKKNIYYPVTPIKTQRTKNKKFIEQSNNMINRQINNESAEFIRSCLKVNLQSEQNKEEDMDVLLRMGNSIINMIFVDNNKILISAFSPDKNLFLTELDRKKENDKYKLSLKLLSLNKIGEKPIIHMEICENGNILSYSDEKIFLLKIVNNLINIIKIIPNSDNNNISNENNFHILSCVSQGNNNILVLKKCENNKNMNELIYYSINNNNENEELTPNKIELPKSYKFTTLEKITNDMCILIGQYLKNTRSNNNSKNVISLGFLKMCDDKFNLTNIRDFKLKEKGNKIFIKKLMDNYIIISESVNSFIIFDIINHGIIKQFQCESMISLEIKDNGKDQSYLYTIEKKETDEKINEESKIKKYFIKKTYNERLIVGNNKVNNIKIQFDINCLNSVNLTQLKKINKINDMIVITDNNSDEKDKNGSDKNFVLLADNAGNIFYKYY